MGTQAASHPSLHRDLAVSELLERASLDPSTTLGCGVVGNEQDASERVAVANSLLDDLDDARLTAFHVQSLQQWRMQIGDVDGVAALTHRLQTHARTPVP